MLYGELIEKRGGIVKFRIAARLGDAEDFGLYGEHEFPARLVKVQKRALGTLDGIQVPHHLLSQRAAEARIPEEEGRVLTRAKPPTTPPPIKPRRRRPTK